ncbi:MAG: DUF333 domain-containing protein [Kiritimatiellae bacterium]|nr:DUF333 domain-containing protein [Kiritimatiellia bacterium]
MKLMYMCFFVVLIAHQALALPNPAAVYCERWGYEYKRVQTPEGEKGIVIIEPGVQFDAWDFFRGKVGKEYSFGAFYGYDIECVRTNIGTYVAEYAVCVSQGKRNQKSGIRVPLQELMEQKGVPLFNETIDGRKKASSGADIPANREEDMFAIYDVMAQGKMIPTAFDWRTNSSHAYIGSIRDQGDCGSCYAFAAAAAAEGTYNWAMGKYDADCVDYSESFIIWCLGRLPQYSDHFFGCGGADYDYAELTALAAEGICLEADFPYTESDPGSCAHESDPVNVFSSWHRVPCGDIDAIKTAIMTYGVVDAAVYVSGGFQSYSGGIYEDANITCYETPCYYTTVNHAIALVGWDDNPPEGGGGCWILRNSWGTSWGESGYMRIRYNAARVACEACYLIYLGTDMNVRPVTGDIDGDGRDDLSAVVKSNWYMWLSSSGYAQRIGPCDLGLSGTPATGDIDGDRLADLITVVVANWYVWLSSSGYAQRIGPCDLGVSGVPTTGNIDGDRLADLISVVDSNWYFWLSSSGYAQRIGPCPLIAP